MQTDSLREKHIVVLGLGISGCAAAELALRLGAVVTVIDAGDGPLLRERRARLSDAGACVILNWRRSPAIQRADRIIISPGVPRDSDMARLAVESNFPITGELEFGYRFCCCPIIAVTGTNGKTTTVELVTHCLRGAGKRVMAAGNIGTPLCEAVSVSASLDYMVVEVSSFQLETATTFAPFAAAILNITDDHLDRYSSFVAYCRAKMRIFQNIRHGNLIIQRNLLDNEWFESKFKPITVAVKSPNCDDADFYLDAHDRLRRTRSSGSECLLDINDLKLQGRHNLENIATAIALCETAGISCRDITPFIYSFAGRPHRLQYVGQYRGVTFINDSKATNPDALANAILTVADEMKGGAGSILLIAGGRNKNMSFASLTEVLRSHVREVLLFGDMRHELARRWRDAVVCKVFPTLETLISVAFEDAVEGDVVLFSPGGTSLDMFDDYRERGNFFVNEVTRRSKT